MLQGEWHSPLSNALIIWADCFEETAAVAEALKTSGSYPSVGDPGIRSGLPK